MFFWITGEVRWPKFFSIVATASRSHSTAARTSYPARSAPRSRPPAPENSEIAMPWVLTHPILSATTDSACEQRDITSGVSGIRLAQTLNPLALARPQLGQLVVRRLQQPLELSLHLGADLEREPAPVLVELSWGWRRNPRQPAAHQGR